MCMYVYIYIYWNAFKQINLVWLVFFDPDILWLMDEHIFNITCAQRAVERGHDKIRDMRKFWAPSIIDLAAVGNNRGLDAGLILGGEVARLLNLNDIASCRIETMCAHETQRKRDQAVEDDFQHGVLLTESKWWLYLLPRFEREKEKRVANVYAPVSQSVWFAGAEAIWAREPMSFISQIRLFLPY